MRRIKIRKELLLQLVVFLTIGILLHKLFFLLLAGLICLILPFEKVCIYVISKQNRVLNFIGFCIKTVLFMLLFVFVIIPVGLIERIKRKKEDGNYIIRNEIPAKDSFKKLW